MNSRITLLKCAPRVRCRSGATTASPKITSWLTARTNRPQRYSNLTSINISIINTHSNSSSNIVPLLTTRRNGGYFLVQPLGAPPPCTSSRTSEGANLTWKNGKKTHLTYHLPRVKYKRRKTNSPKRKTASEIVFRITRNNSQSPNDFYIFVSTT